MPVAAAGAVGLVLTTAKLKRPGHDQGALPRGEQREPHDPDPEHRGDQQEPTPAHPVGEPAEDDADNDVGGAP